MDQSPIPDDLARVERAVETLCARGAGLAAFDADGVLWRGDSGDSFLLWQMDNHRLLPEAEREARQAWEVYRQGRFGDLEMAALCATCQRGLLETEVEADARAFFERDFRGNIVPQTQTWARRLQEAGVEVWIVSGSHRWLVAAGARALGLQEHRLLTVSTVVRNGRLTGQLLLPVTYGAGKAEAIRGHFARGPDLAVGNTLADRFMLELAGLPVAFEPDPELEALARERGWPVVRFAAPH